MENNSEPPLSAGSPGIASPPLCSPIASCNRCLNHNCTTMERKGLPLGFGILHYKSSPGCHRFVHILGAR